MVVVAWNKLLIRRKGGVEKKEIQDCGGRGVNTRKKEKKIAGGPFSPAVLWEGGWGKGMALLGSETQNSGGWLTGTKQHSGKSLLGREFRKNERAGHGCGKRSKKKKKKKKTGQASSNRRAACGGLTNKHRMQDFAKNAL